MTTNTERALWAQNAVTGFANETKMNGEELDNQISDLPCNLIHLADTENLDVSELLDSAMCNYDDNTLNHSM